MKKKKGVQIKIWSKIQLVFISLKLNLKTKPNICNDNENFNFIASCFNFILLLRQIFFYWCVLKSVTYYKNLLPNWHLAIKANNPKKYSTTSHSGFTILGTKCLLNFRSCMANCWTTWIFLLSDNNFHKYYYRPLKRKKNYQAIVTTKANVVMFEEAFQYAECKSN